MLDSLLLVPHLDLAGQRQQLQLIPPTLESGRAVVYLLGDLGGRTASTVLLDCPYLHLIRVVLVSHFECSCASWAGL